ncbi:ATP-grasp fold, succinyl-CoA synthetase-type domain-containing protein [Rozella allomycis CSF55]|uniref:Succinate--CoA ligase [ADP-forming] subunit beta, mitochondrial n=2 Tax=Rozella allomycis (strain CSF55) TaxID=988480 RepID=A0A075B0S1_ROZAC|nr:ATP-grasp fold, succinyl-CoA synthetase-type domain-containing protein [Rozella allomycis CSF55]|eukprot:EPZ36144.1 ATP-grasp fold, succinyl-CoA synthetase-type domain-containing protein [Rozella allomycis CSF55]
MPNIKINDTTNLNYRLSLRHIPNIMYTFTRSFRNRMPQIIKSFIRNLHLHEYQSKQLMSNFGVSIQKFRTVDSTIDCIPKASEIVVVDAEEYVIKAQVHAGGRGKGQFTSGLKSGVHLTRDINAIPGLVEKMIGYNLITHQTTAEGVPVKKVSSGCEIDVKVMIAQALNIASEKYFAIVLDRTAGGPVVVASPVGGVDIEQVAAKNPEKIFKEPIDINVGITDDQAMKIASVLEFETNNIEKAADQIKRLYSLFVSVDATQVEVNPFGETDTGKVVCFDAKITFDDNAAFRQSEIFKMNDETESDPREVEANKFNLNYIGLDGNIGCLVNGAGLAMATMDIIKLYGASPANFLDVGGSATAAQVKEAFKIISADSNVKAILVNIFGGIMKCDVIAQGIVDAVKEIGLNLPLIVRLSGTNMEKGNAILNESGLDISSATDLDDAALKAVEAIQTPKEKNKIKN